MPSFEALLQNAKQHLQTPGYNRALSGLLVRVLQDMVNSLSSDDSLKQEIESMKVSRRVLTSQQTGLSHSEKSRKLASVQRLVCDVHEFLVDYLYEEKKLTRRSAKQAYKNFYSLSFDARSSGLIVNLSETEFDSSWELDALERLANDVFVSVIFWIEEEQIDEKTMSVYETEGVLIVPCLMKQLKSRLSLLKAAAPKESPTAEHKGYFLQKHNIYQGRLRFVINPRSPADLLKKLLKKNLLGYPIMLLPTNMKDAGNVPAVVIQQLRAMKTDIMMSTKDVDIRNFCNMSTVLWVNPEIDPVLSTSTDTDSFSNLRRHILSGLAKHGTVVYEVTSADAGLAFVAAMLHWLPRSNYFRVLMTHHNYKAITAKDTPPDYSSSTITSFILSLRTRMVCSQVPVVVFSTELATIHDSVYNLPLCRPTNSIEEIIDMGAMYPLTWAPDWSIHESLITSESWKADFNIFDISCFNLYPKDPNGFSDPYITLMLNGDKKKKFKSKKQDKTLNPTWKGLNWTMEVKSTDVLHLYVWDHDSFGKDFEGMVLVPIKDVFKTPIPLYDKTLPLCSREAKKDKVSGTITLRMGLSTRTKNDSKANTDADATELRDSDAIIEAARSVIFKGRHFGRYLGESLRTAELSGTRHLTHACILYIAENGLHSIGIFRIVGNRQKVKALKDAFDAGKDITLSDPFVASSLLKSYLRELPDPLLCSFIYEKFIALHKFTTYSKLLPPMRDLLQELPNSNKDLLADILELLHRVTDNQHVNMMNLKNVSTVIAPTICIPKDVSMGDPNELLLDTNTIIDLFQVLIENNRYFFPEDGIFVDKLPEGCDDEHTKPQKLDRSPPSSDSEQGEVEEVQSDKKRDTETSTAEHSSPTSKFALTKT